MRAALLIALVSFSCAQRQPFRDTPQFQVCRFICEREGNPVDIVIETETDIACICKKKPAPEGT